VQFAVQHFGVPDGMPKKLFNKKQVEEIRMFFEFFSPKADAI